MICHRCNNDIHLTDQVRDIDEDYWSETPGPAVMMLWCACCDAQVGALEVYPLGEADFEEVDLPDDMGAAFVPKPNRR